MLRRYTPQHERMAFGTGLPTEATAHPGRSVLIDHATRGSRLADHPNQHPR